MPTLEEIRELETSEETYRIANAKAAQVGARVDANALRRIREQAIKAKSTTAKLYLMRDLAGELAKATAGVVACKDGCHHCCKMATAVSVQEAQLIAKETGAKLHMPKEFNQFARMRELYEAVPCTFLKEGRCGIYSSRPYACRVHYTMDRDDMLCEIHPGHAIKAPHLNTTEYEMSYVQALAGDNPLKMQYADIREFFPNKA